MSSTNETKMLTKKSIDAFSEWCDGTINYVDGVANTVTIESIGTPISFGMSVRKDSEGTFKLLRGVRH